MQCPITYEGKDGKQYVGAAAKGSGFTADDVVPATLTVFTLP
jgi:hypothetical protein